MRCCGSAVKERSGIAERSQYTCTLHVARDAVRRRRPHCGTGHNRPAVGAPILPPANTSTRGRCASAAALRHTWQANSFG